jgi:tripartite-type tricarboxylate transporter receptor subunit TctC
MTIIARKDFEPNTLAELIDYVKANADTVTYANAGIGAASHLCGMLFMSAIDTQVTTVPYQGTGPAMTDILGGQVDFMCDQTTNTTGQIQGGEVKAYVVTSPERLANIPDVPTTAEAGLPEFELGIWHGLYAPAGTPPEVLAKLGEALQAAVADPNVAERFAELGTSPAAPEDVTPEALAQMLTDQIALWKPLIEQAGAMAQ